MWGALLLLENYVVVYVLQGNNVAEHHLCEVVGFVPDRGLNFLVLENQVYSQSTDFLAILMSSGCRKWM